MISWDSETLIDFCVQVYKKPCLGDTVKIWVYLSVNVCLYTEKRSINKKPLA